MAIADAGAADPISQASDREQLLDLQKAFTLLMLCYARAFQQLRRRERYVLHRVEVDGARYATVAGEIGVRPEALKMVVFRARRRLATLLDAELDPRLD